ncbi:hypothetical protein [Bacteriophage sp.]|nr:hypothetical protein [Caudoviricetes sp.]UOF79990.1 hypothetical protein [Bacteriophage sp.]
MRLILLSGMRTRSHSVNTRIGTRITSAMNGLSSIHSINVMMKEI